MAICCDLIGRTCTRGALALSDVERSQSYSFCGEAPFPVAHFRATLRVTPVTDGGSAFVEWAATFDCAPEQHGEWTSFFQNGFARWLGSLRRYLDGQSK